MLSHFGDLIIRQSLLFALSFNLIKLMEPGQRIFRQFRVIRFCIIELSSGMCKATDLCDVFLFVRNAFGSVN